MLRSLRQRILHALLARLGLPARRPWNDRGWSPRACRPLGITPEELEAELFDPRLR